MATSVLGALQDITYMEMENVCLLIPCVRIITWEENVLLAIRDIRWILASVLLSLQETQIVRSKVEILVSSVIQGTSTHKKTEAVKDSTLSVKPVTL